MIALLWMMIFAVASHGHGDHGKDALDAIEKSQEVLQTFGNPTPPANDCPNCTSVDHPHERRIACAEAICKDAKLDLQKIESAAVKNSPFVPAKDEAAKLEALFDKWWAQRNARNQDYIKALQATDLKVSAETKRLLGFTKFFNGIDKVKFNSAVPIGRFSILRPINAQQTAAAFPELDADAQAAMVEMATVYFNELDQESAQTHAYPIEIILQEKHPNLNRAQAFRREIEISKKLIHEVKSSPDFAKMAAALGAESMDGAVDFDALSKIEDPSNRQILDVIRFRSNFNLLREIIDPNSSLSKSANRLQDPNSLTEANRQKQLDVMAENAKFLGDVRTKERMRQRYVSRCIARLNYGVQVLPTDKDLEIARQNSEAAKADIEQKILPKFSTATRERAAPKIRETRFVFPPSKEAFRRNFRDFLKSSHIAIDSEAPESGEFAVARALSPQLQTEDRLSNFASQCDEFKNPMVSDASYGANGAIQAGWRTTRDPQFGRFVMGHELGHRLADIFNQIELSGESKKRQDHMISCISMMHGAYGGGHGHRDEDWADWIGAEIAGNNGENPLCWRVDLASVKEKKTSVSLLNEKPDSPHSSPFFRLIQIQRYSGRPMPPGCKQTLLEQNPMMAIEMKCSDPIPELKPGQLYGNPGGTGRMLPGYGLPAGSGGFYPVPKPVRPTE